MRNKLVTLSALVSLLPLLVWWREFSRLFFFHDDWELLHGAAENPLISWLFQPFLDEGVFPLFKLLWISAVRISGGSYLAMMVLLWLTHFIVLLVLDRLLLRFGCSQPAAAVAVITLGLPWSNLETLSWSMQWNAVLAILFWLIAWHLLLNLLEGNGSLVLYVACVLACGLVSTRGVFYGAVLAAFIVITNRRKLALMVWSVAPSILLTAVTLLAKGHAPAPLSESLSFAVHNLFLNPLYTLISYPGRHIGMMALLLFGAMKAALFLGAMARSNLQTRSLLLTLLAFDILNSLALGYGRAYTGNLATIASRYQYTSLLCLGPALGILVASFRKEIALILVLAWIGVIGYPWKTHIGRWAIWRGDDIRSAIQTGAPASHFDPSMLTVEQARKLIQQYGLH